MLSELRVIVTWYGRPKSDGNGVEMATKAGQEKCSLVAWILGKQVYSLRMVEQGQVFLAV